MWVCECVPKLHYAIVCVLLLKQDTIVKIERINVESNVLSRHKKIYITFSPTQLGCLLLQVFLVWGPLPIRCTYKLDSDSEVNTEVLD